MDIIIPPPYSEEVTNNSSSIDDVHSIFQVEKRVRIEGRGGDGNQ